MANKNKQNLPKKVKEEGLREVVISPSQLPIFSVANAIHMSYNTSIVRLANTLNLGNFEPIDTFLYRVYVNNAATGENCCIVQNGSDEYEPTGLPFEVFISFMTILQIKTYNATYAAGGPDGGATIYITGDDIVSRIELLFKERPEFELWDILCEGGGDASAEAQEEDQEETPVSSAGA